MTQLPHVPTVDFTARGGVSARDRYRTAAACRAALDRRLRAQPRASDVPLNQLRKEVSF